jgi:ArsR family transcriptional regulator, arsenate/arsenite/antimonite-responsive transcriptional repressor
MDSYKCFIKSDQLSANIHEVSHLLKLVSEESRLKILCILRSGAHCVCELIPHVNLSQSLISHHLSDLKNADIVKNTKKGLRVYYSLTEKGNQIINLILQL